ncbi:ASCH domain-containing protein [Agrococcus sp. 1P02AA]|uniref:ASCH domain-containing protein n=1 Tax=Agrococcus sp. 1P02AA TaxID=3132259 RepID=UPI0039A4B051
MWQAYAAAHPEAVRAAAEHTVERFGDSERLSDELLEIVLSGRKRATSSLVADFVADGEQLPRIGSHWIACDGRGAPRIVMRSTDLRIGAFDSVEPTFAAAEGEDDGSVESWKREHRRYWQRTTAARGEHWSEADEIVFERFTVVWPPEHAD